MSSIAGPGYQLVSHAGVPDLPQQALDLATSAFAGYVGVTLPTAGKVNWYLARPRMRRDLSQGVLTAEGELVSSVYITLEQVRLAGALRPVALVDTVMTAPAHRQQGLARLTLEAALAAARDAGAVAALLFTVPDSMPYIFYQTLGFRPVVSIRVMARESSEVSSPAAAPIALCADAAPLTAFWNRAYAGHDGYVPVDGALWRWRREQRPQVLPAETWVAPEVGAVCAAVNYCTAPVIGAASLTLVLTDLAWTDDASGRQAARALLAGVPAGAEARLLAAENDTALLVLLEKAGFSEIGREAAMLAPLAPQADALLSTLRAPWYPLAESVIGV